MERLRNRLVVLLLLLGVSTGLVWAHHFAYGVWRPKSDLKIPLFVGEWRGRDKPVAKRVYELLEADTVIIRTYIKGNSSIWFAVVYYKDNQVGFHAPESCFGGLGNQVFDEGNLSLFIPRWNRSVKVNRRHYKGPKGEKILLYFYSTGEFITESYFKIRVQMLYKQLKFQKPGVALFELYCPVGPEGEGKAVACLKDFLSELIPLLPSYIK